VSVLSSLQWREAVWLVQFLLCYLLFLRGWIHDLIVSGVSQADRLGVGNLETQFSANWHG
jgi:hypothetical protein